MAYHKITNKSKELENLREKGITRGKDTGLKPLDAVFSLVKGYPLYFAGEPGSGKTEVVMEILLNTSVLMGWKHFVYFGEAGDVEDVIADLCYKYIGKPFKKTSGYAMSDTERIQAEMFIDEHFVFMDDEDDVTLTEFYSEVEKAEKEYGWKFHTTVFDPFNDAVDESSSMGGTHHWLNRELKMVRKVSRANKRIDILVNHVADIAPSIDKESGRAYKRPALPDEWNGGRTWRRRGFGMILAYIPPVWLKDENGMEYGENVSLLYIQKAKPKGTATYGGVAKLHWDWKHNRYYWLDTHGTRQVAFMTNKPKDTIQPNTDFANG